ncbi:MAG TPA: thioredoxin domain-containing protein [Crinalium sp.]|jgi:protein-disulfide isomerase
MPISTPEVPYDGQGDRLLVPVSSRDHIRESVNASVVLVEYGNYQCPDCGAAHQAIQTLQHQLNHHLQVVFRHFPQIRQYPQSQKAAEAAEAAGAQGQFWQMHDTLFKHQYALDDSSLVEYADALKLDIPRFLRDVSGHVYLHRIIQDMDSGHISGVVYAPALFINNMRYRDALTVEALHNAISNICAF